MSHSETRRNTKKHSRNQRSDSPEFILILSASIKSALIALAVSVALSFAACAAAISGSDPTAYILPLSLAVLYISSLLAGFLSARFKGDSALICGLLSGGLFMLLTKLVTLFLPDGAPSERQMHVSLLLHFLIFLFSALGAYLARNISKSRKPKRNKR